MRVLLLSLMLIGTGSAQTNGLDHVWGRITALTKDGFVIDQNYNADPASAYRRQKREIRINSDTRFEESARGDLRPGRTVDVIGLKKTGSVVQATRVVVYEGNSPVRMKTGGRVISPDGSVRISK